MQRKKSVWKRIGDKGYYIALAVCAAAVAVSGILFVKSLRPASKTAATQTDAHTSAVLDEHLLAGIPQPGVDAPVAVIETVPKEEETEPAAPTEPAEPEQPVITRPVEGSVSGAYSMDKLSYNPTVRDWRTHAGVDYAVPEGTEVHAAAAGKVRAVYQDDLLGWTVTVEHADGWVTHYSNLAEDVAVAAGDEVTSGQKLGVVGKTAMLELADEPHLHFAVYRNNVPQDPEAFLG